MKVRDLVKLKTAGTSAPLWSVLMVKNNSILVLNQKTRYKMWAEKSHFEVVK